MHCLHKQYITVTTLGSIHKIMSLLKCLRINLFLMVISKPSLIDPRKHPNWVNKTFVLLRNLCLTIQKENVGYEPWHRCKSYNQPFLTDHVDCLYVMIYPAYLYIQNFSINTSIEDPNIRIDGSIWQMAVIMSKVFVIHRNGIVDQHIVKEI